MYYTILEEKTIFMDKFIPLSIPNFCGNERKYVDEAVASSWVSTGGALVNGFEQSVSTYVGSKYAVAVQSGTAGLHLSCLELKIGCDDEVIVPTLTFIAAINPVKYVNAEPIFMDCDDDLCMDLDKLQEFCETECNYFNGKLINQKTSKHIKAVIIVHVFGNMCDMEKLDTIAKRYSLKIIEDATEALGSYCTKGKFNGKFAGTIGDIGVFSFNGNKIISTGGGGMIVTNNELMANHMKYLSTQAKDDEVYFKHNEIGFNYRMTNLQAALGVAQMEQLEKFVAIKIVNFELYNKLGVKLLPFNENIHSNHWFYSFMSNNRDGLIKYLSLHKIQSRPIWQLINTLRPYEKAQSFKISKASYYYNKVVNIPCSTNLNLNDVEYVCGIIKEYEKN